MMTDVIKEIRCQAVGAPREEQDEAVAGGSTRVSGNADAVISGCTSPL